MLISGDSGRGWHVIKVENVCHYGQLFLAAEVVYWLWPNGNWQVQVRGYFAVKVRPLIVILQNILNGVQELEHFCIVEVVH